MSHRRGFQQLEPQPNGGSRSFEVAMLCGQDTDRCRKDRVGRHQMVRPVDCGQEEHHQQRDLVFISSATAAEYANAKRSLTEGGVNNRLLDCSDAHHWADSRTKTGSADCFTWVKADPTFEGLRQAVFEYPSRVHVADVPPIEPFLQIRKATLTFPPKTYLSRADRSDVFCFSGTREIAFSPYLTCIIGGRGTGKSTLLNLIHEKLDAGSTELFRQNRLLPAGTSVAAGVTIDGISERASLSSFNRTKLSSSPLITSGSPRRFFPGCESWTPRTCCKRMKPRLMPRLRQLRVSSTLKSHHELS